ncbi:MAG: CBS domain-containing protein [Clostridium sp.]|jgi:CBS domain-containing protein|uniref:CBS domain-containing protein n=1 Tax=Clostridium sp. TaxID=1506 RepID=UPI0025B8ECBE|nr:CBS domain-containing protein [Clostridium sp.]MCH3965231.1 CBS domain-containing protein [Clostridium sp.]MCI1714451.1 CBS domain-containing protein [Clostridium sp.]MCI1798713.1 CBS domain-containing protein [Clostridium sp.]MCI1812556.1 CBS domain-containing protein [Clostridium sp.]MCI1869523.1 CBS domain-containing protein [Clostridium sp.]
MKIRDIMTQSVVSLNVNDTIERAAELMEQYNIGSVPVCEGNKVVGMITDRDIAIRSSSQGQNSKTKVVRDVMSSNPVTASPDMDVCEVSRIMSERQIRRIPIVENDNLVGIVALGDLAVDPKLEHEAEGALSSISETSGSAF